MRQHIVPHNITRMHRPSLNFWHIFEGKILPLFNRTVIFSTTDTSFHGHPHPLTSPAGTSRKSVSLYYYTAGRPEAERSAPHDTIFIP